MESNTAAAAPQTGIKGLSLRLKYSRDLPTLPAVAMRVLERAEDPAATLTDFGNLIQQDPALAGKLLRAANSSFYGRPCQVGSIPAALRILGINATVALVLTFSLRGMPTRGVGVAFDPDDYWRDSIITAFAAHALAEELGEPHPEDFLLAGLLREIGALVLHMTFGERYAAVCATATGDADLRQREQALFGFDHVDAGTLLLQGWRLPQPMVDSVRQSHATGIALTPDASPSGRLAACVGAAARVVTAWVRHAPPATVVLETTAAARDLQLTADQLRRVVEAIGARVPEIEALFQIRIVDPKVLEALEEAARELSLVRDMQEATAVPPGDTRTRALEQQVAVLEEQTQRDPMTGLYNRAHLEHVLEREFAHATQSREPLSVAFIDLDHFKAVNDTFGHPAGDQVLITTARRLEASARQTDTVVRYGGEEFVVLMAGTTSRDAALAIERMLGAVRDPPFRTRDGAAGQVTFSAGVATHMESGRALASARELVAAADRALYRAKRLGRGRVVVDTPAAAGD